MEPPGPLLPDITAMRVGNMPRKANAKPSARAKPLGPAPMGPEQLPLADLLDRVDHGIALSDPEGRVRWCNPLLAECYLQAEGPEEWQGKPFTELFGGLFPHRGDWERVAMGLDRLAHAPKGRVELGDLSLAWGGRPMRRIDLVLCDLSEGASANGKGWVAWFFYDTTAVRKTEENLQALLLHSYDGIFMIDDECRLRVFNEACERITGYTADEVIQGESSCNRIFQCSSVRCGSPTGRACSNDFCFKHGQLDPQTRVHQIQRKSGEMVWAEVSYAPVFDDQGEMAYVLGILRDVTRRHQLEEQLRLTRKLATLGELTSAMAHEIKNPLGIIMSASEIILSPERSEDQKRQAAQFIRDEVRRLDERMKVFLKFSRPRPPDIKPQDVRRVLTQTILAYQTLARDELRILTHLDEDLPDVLIDADQMQQVFLNLIMNGDQAMHGAGTIEVTGRRLPSGEIAIEVADEGVGLPEGDRSQLFEPFFSTKAKGTGLGLSIVLHIVTAHQGRVEAGNRPQGGAVFTVVLPVAGGKGASA